MLSFSWFPAVREKRYTQDCAHAKGSFRRMSHVGLPKVRTRRETSLHDSYRVGFSSRCYTKRKSMLP